MSARKKDNPVLMKPSTQWHPHCPECNVPLQRPIGTYGWCRVHRKHVNGAYKRLPVPESKFVRQVDIEPSSTAYGRTVFNR